MKKREERREKVKKDEREINKKLFFFSVLVNSVPKWNNTIHMWQKL